MKTVFFTQIQTLPLPFVTKWTFYFLIQKICFWKEPLILQYKNGTPLRLAVR
jgi:hypothetical protein